MGRGFQHERYLDKGWGMGSRQGKLAFPPKLTQRVSGNGVRSY
jgi:hypothetical protein